MNTVAATLLLDGINVDRSTQWEESHDSNVFGARLKAIVAHYRVCPAAVVRGLIPGFTVTRLISVFKREG